MSPSESPSESPSLSPSSSESPSESSSLSPSESPSLSPSSSESPSLSPSASVSPSPSPGYNDYTKGNYATLPADDTSLENDYTGNEVTYVSVDDDDYTDQVGTVEFIIHQFKDYFPAPSTITCKLKTTFAPATSTVYLQIYNRNTPGWETVDSDNSSAVNNDFVLDYYIADVTDYIDASDVISCRVYQEAI